MNQTLEVVPVPIVAARVSVADFVTLTKPGITSMVAVTVAAGFHLASTGPLDLALLLHTIIGAVLSAAGAATLNMYVERDIDAKMVRTRNRPLPAGRMAAGHALAFGTILCVTGTAYLAVIVNPLTAALGAATILSYVGLYTPLKRVSSLCTLVGAVPGALPPVMGWAAARGTLEPGALGIFLILFFWQLPHFLALAWLYREDYARAGQPMLPVAEPDGASTGRQVVLQTLALIVASVAPVWMGIAGAGYLVAALALGTAFLGFGIAFACVRSRERASRLFLASITYLPILLGALALGRVAL